MSGRVDQRGNVGFGIDRGWPEERFLFFGRNGWMAGLFLHVGFQHLKRVGPLTIAINVHSGTFGSSSVF